MLLGASSFPENVFFNKKNGYTALLCTAIYPLSWPNSGKNQTEKKSYSR